MGERFDPLWDSLWTLLGKMGVGGLECVSRSILLFGLSDWLVRLDCRGWVVGVVPACRRRSKWCRVPFWLRGGFPCVGAGSCHRSAIMPFEQWILA